MSVYWVMMNESILHMESDKMIPRYAFHKPFTVTLPDSGKWNRGMATLKKGGHLVHGWVQGK
jgi:hypothetical protein